MSELVDKAVALDVCDGDEEMLDIIFDAYVEEADEKKVALEESYDAKNWKDYATYAHGMKSSAKTIGAMPLAEKALAHEMAGKEANEEFINADYEAFLKLYDETLDAVKGMLE